MFKDASEVFRFEGGAEEFGKLGLVGVVFLACDTGYSSDFAPLVALYVSLIYLRVVGRAWGLGAWFLGAYFVHPQQKYRSRVQGRAAAYKNGRMLRGKVVFRVVNQIT